MRTFTVAGSKVTKTATRAEPMLAVDIGPGLLGSALGKDRAPTIEEIKWVLRHKLSTSFVGARVGAMPTQMLCCRHTMI